MASDPTAAGRAIVVETMPVEIAPAQLHAALRPLGAWVLSSEDPDFGGLSAVVIESGRLTAVTDRGHWLRARLTGPPALTLEAARLAPLRTAAGRALGGAAADAEGLTRAGGALYVAFERDHRIMRHAGAGQLSAAARAADWQGLGDNEGLEALATAPDGALIAIAEGHTDAGSPLWRIRSEGGLAKAHLPAPSRHKVTGADLGPDGRLYLVLRAYDRVRGVSIRVVRYALDAQGWPEPGSRTRLAAYEEASGIDNMEGIAVTDEAQGRAVLWLISDDNFNARQRTLLMAFALGGR